MKIYSLPNLMVWILPECIDLSDISHSMETRSYDGGMEIHFSTNKGQYKTFDRALIIIFH